MPSITRRFRPRIAISLTVSLAVAACGGGGSTFEPPPDPEPAVCDAATFTSQLPPTPGQPAAVPPSIAVQQAFTAISFDQPLAMLQAPADDTRWFVVERQGTIRVFPNEADVVAGDVEMFADLRNRVNSSPGEGGLLGMAFHPDFQNSGEVYVSYTRGTPLESVVSCFTVDGSSGALDTGSEEILLTVPQPNTNHNGGNVAFGPDGFMYIGFGDGGGAGDPGENAQDTTNVLGTIVRIDIGGPGDYAIPADNPFAGNTECTNGSGTMPCPEIFAYGFRNPWRFSFDRDTGELWAGDVGQASWEEVDRVEISLNYGWDEREGAHCFEPTNGCNTNNVDPVTEYDHGVGRSITGGYVYRGDTFPGLQGLYVFGDFATGRIWSVPFDSPIGTPPDPLADTALSISSFAESNEGELFVLDFGNGTIHRIVEN